MTMIGTASGDRNHSDAADCPSQLLRRRLTHASRSGLRAQMLESRTYVRKAHRASWAAVSDGGHTGGANGQGPNFERGAAHLPTTYGYQFDTVAGSQFT